MFVVDLRNHYIMSESDYKRRTNSRTPGNSASDERGTRLRRVDLMLEAVKSHIRDSRARQPSLNVLDRHLDLVALLSGLERLKQACQSYIDNHNEPHSGTTTYSMLYRHRRNGRTEVLEDLRRQVVEFQKELAARLRNYEVMAKPTGPWSGLQVLWPIDLEDI